MMAHPVLLVLLLVVFIVIVSWYGGNSAPLTQQEIAAFFDQLHQYPLELDHSELLPQIATLLENDDGREFVMANLIKYRDQAQYPASYTQQHSASALAADRRYGRLFLPKLLRYANIPLFYAFRRGSFIEAAGQEYWQAVALVRYRSRRDFLRSVTAIMGKNVSVHKWAAIQTTLVFPVRPVISLFFIRTLLALGLFSVYALMCWVTV